PADVAWNFPLKSRLRKYWHETCKRKLEHREHQASCGDDQTYCIRSILCGGTASGITRDVDRAGAVNAGPTERRKAGPFKKSSRGSINDRLQKLAKLILHKHDISEEEPSLMMKGQNFNSDPRLALAYYYCCGGQPDAFVFNDEHIRDDESFRERLLNVMDAPPGLLEYERCQASSATNDPSNGSSGTHGNSIIMYRQIACNAHQHRGIEMEESRSRSPTNITGVAL
ncbi:uncharacterized protein PITG_21983, partial [Phytophthora infestans T30-4]